MHDVNDDDCPRMMTEIHSQDRNWCTVIAFLKCLDSPSLKYWQWLTKYEVCASFMMTVQVCVNAELWWTWQVIKCSQWHDLIVLNIQWYGVICFLRYAWWCLHIPSDKYSTVQGMIWQWAVCTSRFGDWYVTDIQVVQCGTECVSDNADLAMCVSAIRLTWQ